MIIYMTSDEFDDLADYLQGKYADRVREEGASFTIRQMAKELGKDERTGKEISEETLRRLLNKRIKKRGVNTSTLRILVTKYGQAINDILGITPKF